MRRLFKFIGICSLLALPSAFESRGRTVSNPLPDQIWVKFDEYSGISSKKEKFRLNNFVIQLREWKGSNAFIVAYAGRRSCKGEAQARANRVKKYLIESGGIEASRIITIDAGYQDEWTIELYLAPHEAPPLTLAMIKETHPGLRADQVQIRGQCKREFRERL
jgi:hypothetical protein